MGTASRHYYAKDHLGSTRAVVDYSGAVVERHDYDAYGMELAGRGVVGSPVMNERYTGHQFDAETGLLYAGARFLDPALGRWLGVDRFAVKYPSLSPYNYAADNPLLYIDINGDSLYAENRVNRSGFWGAVAGFFGAKRTDTYVYRSSQGWFNTKTGNQASSNSGFVGRVAQAVATLEGTTTGARVVTAVANGRQNATIVAGGDGNGFRGGISSGTITWNPNLMESGLNTAGNTERPAFVGLGHELAHAYDAFGHDGVVGITPGDWGQMQTVNGPRMIGLSEKFASEIENMIRLESGLPQRTHYGLNASTRQGLLPIPLINPIIPQAPSGWF